jgi:L-2-hydroxyglutarate oxidase
VPDPRFPFLGVHLTRTIHGTVEAGPNAVLALSRHGYRPSDLSPSDVLEMIAWPGWWRMAARQGLRGLEESRRAVDAGAFLRAVRRLVPAIQPDDLRPARSGVRAQALGPDGRLLDDFHVVEGERMLHVINAPSPAATASLAIGRHVAERALARFDPDGRDRRR